MPKFIVEFDAKTLFFNEIVINDKRCLRIGDWTQAPSFNKLLQSIKEIGLVEPLGVVQIPNSNGMFELITGWRRYAALEHIYRKRSSAQQNVIVRDMTQSCGYSMGKKIEELSVPVIDYGVRSEREILTFQLAIAVATEELGPGELALALHKLSKEAAPREKLMSDNTQSEWRESDVTLFRAIGIEMAYGAKLLRAVRKAPELVNHWAHSPGYISLYNIEQIIARYTEPSRQIEVYEIARTIDGPTETDEEDSDEPGGPLL